MFNHAMIVNKISNFSKDYTAKSLNSASLFGGKSSSAHLQHYQASSTYTIQRTESKLASLSVQPESTEKQLMAQSISAEAVAEIDAEYITEEESFIDDYDGYVESINEDTSTSISDYASSLCDSIGESYDTVSGVVSDAISNAVASITALATKLKDGFIKALTDIKDKALEMISNLVSKFMTTINGFMDTATKIKDKVYNFFERQDGESSTSKYIQANIPSPNGGMVANTKALAGTPEDKIIVPQLKSDTNQTLSFAANPIAKLLGFVSSLIPTKNAKKIEEPKPSGAKAEYGKIVVQENAGGTVKISDETPGNEREITQHKSGSYTLIKADGSSDTKTTGDKQEINNGVWNIKTEKDKVEIIAGDNKIEIRKNVEENIKGNTDTNIDGTNNNVIKGDVTNDFKSNYIGKIAKDYSESVDGKRVEKTGNGLEETISGNHKETITNGYLTIHVSGNVNIVSGGTTNISAANTVNISAKRINLG